MAAWPEYQHINTQSTVCISHNASCMCFSRLRQSHTLVFRLHAFLLLSLCCACLHCV